MYICKAKATLGALLERYTSEAIAQKNAQNSLLQWLVIRNLFRLLYYYIVFRFKLEILSQVKFHLDTSKEGGLFECGKH